MPTRFSLLLSMLMRLARSPLACRAPPLIRSSTGLTSSVAGIAIVSSGTICTSARSACGDAIAAQGVLQNRLLLQQVGLRNHQVLLAGIELRFGARDFDLGQRADGPPAFRLSSSNCCAVSTLLLARAHVFIEADQVPVQVENRRNRGDHLLLELQVGHFQVVLLHADVAAVHRRSEPLQQVLRHLQIEVARRCTGFRLKNWLFTLMYWLE